MMTRLKQRNSYSLKGIGVVVGLIDERARAVQKKKEFSVLLLHVIVHE
jgi:hypothetical protein